MTQKKKSAFEWMVIKWVRKQLPEDITEVDLALEVHQAALYLAACANAAMAEAAHNEGWSDFSQED